MKVAVGLRRVAAGKRTSGRRAAQIAEVDWAGDPAHIIDPDTGEILDAHCILR